MWRCAIGPRSTNLECIRSLRLPAITPTLRSIFRSASGNTGFRAILKSRWCCLCSARLSGEQDGGGGMELMQTPFTTFERNIRDQLARMLRGGGFDAARDIEGITVNRWAHGYAFTPNALFDPDWKEEEKPWVIGRKRFGSIAIANSDAGADAYTNVAIDQAHRAVAELAEGRS